MDLKVVVEKPKMKARHQLQRGETTLVAYRISKALKRRFKEKADELGIEHTELLKIAMLSVIRTGKVKND